MTTASPWTLFRVDALCTVLLCGSDKTKTADVTVSGNLTPGFFILSAESVAKRFVDRNFDTIGECVKEVGWNLAVEGWEDGDIAVALVNSEGKLAGVDNLQELQRCVRAGAANTPIDLGIFLKSLFDVSVATWRVAMQLPGTASGASPMGGGGFVMPLEVEGLTPGQSLRLAMEMQQMEAAVMGSVAGVNVDVANKPSAINTTDGVQEEPHDPRGTVAKHLEGLSFVIGQPSDESGSTDTGGIIVVSGPSDAKCFTFLPSKGADAARCIENAYATALLLLHRISHELAKTYSSVNPALSQASVCANVADHTPLILLAAATSHQRLLMSNPGAAVGLPRAQFPLMILDQLAAWTCYNVRAKSALDCHGVTGAANSAFASELQDENKSTASAQSSVKPADLPMIAKLAEVSARIGTDGAGRTSYMSSLREALNAGL